MLARQIIMSNLQRNSFHLGHPVYKMGQVTSLLLLSWELFKTPTNSLESQFTCSAIESAKDRPIHFFFFTLPFEREGNTIYPRQESHQKKSLRLLLWELKSWLVCLINVPIFRQSQRLKNKPQNVIYPSFLSGIHWILRICLLLFENEFSKGFLMFP